MELETHLIIACNLKFLGAEDFALVLKPFRDIEKMLNRLIAVLRNGKKDKGHPPRDPNPETRIADAQSRVPYPLSHTPRAA